MIKKKAGKMFGRYECWTHSTALTKNAVKERIMAISKAIHGCNDTQVDYRNIEGFPGYRVGSDGTIWTCIIKGKGSRLGGEWRKMYLGDGNNGYKIVGLTNNGKRETKYVHHLVLEAFVGKRPCGSMHGCHFPDPDKANNALENLRWCTPSENNQHKTVQGTHQIGEKNPRAKLTESSVREIRRLYAHGVSAKAIAESFSVTDTLVRLIVKRKCWRHVA